MEEKEAVGIFNDWFLNHVANSLYKNHIHGGELQPRSAVTNLLPKEESLDGFCIVAFGSIDNLPADVPKPENPYKGLLVVYDKETGPYEFQL